MSRRTTVAVVVYNIHGGKARTALQRVVTALAPDVLVVNEAPKVPLLWRRRRDSLARDWGLRRVVGGRDAGQNLLCAADRVKVTASAAQRLRQPLFAPMRGLASAQCVVGGRPFGVVGVHLSLTAERRPAEARAAIEVADRLQGPVLVCGDLNERPGQGAWREFVAAGYVDVGRDAGPTFDSANPHKRIDAVLVKRGHIRSCEVPALPPSLLAEASDHLPVRAELDLGPP